MPTTWIGHLIAGIFGALITAVTMYVRFDGRLTRVETRQDSQDAAIKSERERNDERIDHVREAAAAVLEIAGKVLDQSNRLIMLLEAREQTRAH